MSLKSKLGFVWVRLRQGVLGPDVQSRDDCAVFRGRSEFGRWGSKLKQARGFFITGR